MPRWFDSWVEAVGKRALSRQPDAITLVRAPEARWRVPASAERLAAPLREKGFVDLGLYEIRPRHGYRLGVMLNERSRTAAFLTELPTGTVALELSVRYLDGTTTALVGRADDGVPRPPFFRVIFGGADASSAELYERLLRERTPTGIKEITAENVIPEYQAAYARIMAYTKGMGLSAAQVRDIAARARQPATYIPSQSPSAAPPSSGAKEIACPHCGQLNEGEREVCWVCSSLLRGAAKPAAAAPPSANSPEGPVPFPLRELLRAGERVLWHGRPLDRLDFRDMPLAALPAGLLAVFAALFFMRAGGPWSVGVGAFFLAAGLVVLGGTFLQRVLRRGDLYAVTDRRVLIVHGRPWRRVIARGLTDVAAAGVVSETFEGAGDVELRFSVWTSADSDFVYVENARDVAGLVHLARQEAAARPLAAGAGEGDAPAALARLVVPLHCAALALCVLLAASDLAAIFRSGGEILRAWAAYEDRGALPQAAVFVAVPFMLAFLYRRLKRFQEGTRAARTADIMLLAAFVAIDGSLFCFGDLAFPKTLLSLIFGAFLLLGAAGREVPR